MTTDSECSVISHLPPVSGRGRDPRERSHNRRVMKCCEEEVGVSQGFKKRRNGKKCCPNILWAIFKHRNPLGVHGLVPSKPQEIQRPNVVNRVLYLKKWGLKLQWGMLTPEVFSNRKKKEMHFYSHFCLELAFCCWVDPVLQQYFTKCIS